MFDEPWSADHPWHRAFVDAPRFVVVDLDFGDGDRFIETWDVWRGHFADVRRARRGPRLHWIALKADPVGVGRCSAVARDRGSAADPHHVLRTQLRDAWPVATPDLHAVELDDGLVRLMIVPGEPAQALRQLRAVVDAFHLGRGDTILDRRDVLRAICRSMARLASRSAVVTMDGPGSMGGPGGLDGAGGANRGACAGTGRSRAACVEAWRMSLRDAGFEIVPDDAADAPSMQGFTHRRRRQASAIELLARFDPARRRIPSTAPDRTPPAPQGRGPVDVVVIGAGLAGALVARSLARSGCSVRVLDASVQVASQASGHPAGIFHGTVHAVDGTHARFNRVAALHAARLYAGCIGVDVRGSLDGFVRSDAPWPASGSSDVRGASGAGHPSRSAATALMSAGYVRRVSRGDPLMRGMSAAVSGGWWFAQGGWLAPAELVAHALRTPGVTTSCRSAVSSIERADAGGAMRWVCRDAEGHGLASAERVVLAPGANLPQLIASIRWSGVASLPTFPSAGQVNWFDIEHDLPRAVGGHGYAVGLGPATVLCGATTHALLDPGPNPEGAASTLPVRDAVTTSTRVSDGMAGDDDAFNLRRLDELTGLVPPVGAVLHRRSAVRCMTPDRLPMVGPMPIDSAHVQSRDVPRVPGILLMAALGGRGLTWGPLMADTVAAMIVGDPLPLPADLVDAIDPARWVARRARRQGG